MPQIPKKLYKYRPFNTHSVTELERNIVFYANPLDFNDPLDCSPVVDIDLDFQKLEELCHTMLVEQCGLGKEDAEAFAEKRIKQLRRFSVDTEYGSSQEEVLKQYVSFLRREIQECLDGSMKNKGVLSLAQNWNCPLMWSHYADQHKGICIEYDTTDLEFASPKRVDYSGIRDIKASDLYGWKIENRVAPRDRVHESYFFRKARQWRYEKEWRHVRDSNGEDGSPFLISAVYFGLRCDTSVESMIANLFVRADHEPRLYRIREDTKTFNLKRYEPGIDELTYDSPRISEHWRIRELTAMFSDLTVEKS